MGEIADSMIYGDVCEMCGTPFEDEGSGFPRYCSTECAKDRGASFEQVVGFKRKKKTKQPPMNLVSIKATFDGRPLFWGRRAITITGYDFEGAEILAEKIRALIEEDNDKDEE